MYKYTLLICVSIFALSLLSGCNTAEGFGRDLQDAGRAIDNAID